MSDRERHWQGLVDAFRRSGLSQSEFCRQRGINQGTFSWWKRELPRRAGRPTTRRAAARAEFAEFRSARGGLAKVATVSAGRPRQASGYELVLANGRSIRVPVEFEPAVLSRLIEAAESC